MSDLPGEAGSEAAQFWDKLYRDRPGRMWSGKANPVLVDMVTPLQAGAALDLGCGEGGDAIWLAQRGWKVTAADISNTALERGFANAAAAGVSTLIDWVSCDLTEDFPTGSFDLVSAQYLQAPFEFPRERVYQSAAAAVARGGLLLIVEHGAVRPPWAWKLDGYVMPTPAKIFESLSLGAGQWDAPHLASPARQATHPDGQTATVTDNVIAVRRRRS